MPQAEIDKFFHDVSRDPSLHRALLKRCRSPADFYPQAAKLARLLGYAFTAEEMRDWAESSGGLPQVVGAPPAVPVPAVARASAGTAEATVAPSVSAPAAGAPPGQSPWSLRSWRIG